MQQIPFDKRTGLIWYNNQFLPWQEANIHILTHGLHYASCVFEGERIYNSKVFMLNEHNIRFHQSAKMLGFTIPYSVKQLNKATKELIIKQNLNSGYVRPFAWRGSDQMKIAAPYVTINTAIAAWELNKYYQQEQEAIRLNISSWRKPPPDTVPFQSKAAGLYMICTLAKHQALEEGYDDALMLDYRGFIAEGSSANFFMVINNQLHTPIADCFLAGITRGLIINLARKRKIKVIERHIELSELAKADEVFLTGTAVELISVKQIAQHNYHSNKMTKLLIQDYQELVNIYQYNDD